MDGFTDVCEATSQSLDFDSFRPTHRKGKKLLAEKKRRARINNCLMRIRDIVCHGEEEKETDLDKMEKAEILEKTLELLTRLRHDFDNTRKMNNSQSTHKAMAVRYASGFSSCAEESIRYIQSSRLIPTEVKHQLQTHLRSIARRMESNIQEKECDNYVHSYTSSPSVVIAPPQIVPLTSATTPHLSTSMSFLVDKNDGTAMLQISPSRNMEFPMSCMRSNNQSDDIVMSMKSQMNFKPPTIPSPIRSSTPMMHISDRKLSISPPIDTSNLNKIDHSSAFIPLCNTELSHNHKENQPSNMYHSNTQSLSDGSQFKISSAFNKFVPHHFKPASPKSEDEFQRQQKNMSLSSSSEISSSQYSPISPVASPVIVHTSTFQPTSYFSTSEYQHPVYSYHGYEPYPAHLHPDVESTPVDIPHPSQRQVQTPNKAIDLCVKRNDSHNISPETMWRPW